MRRSAPKRRRRLPRRHLLELTDVLSVMMDSGLMLRDALEVAGSVFRERSLVRLVDGLLSHVERGGAFHSAVDALPWSFPPVYRALVRIGERTGSIASVLKRLSLHLRREARVRERLAIALLYPAIVLTIAVAGAITTLLFVLPRMEAILTAAGNGSASNAGRHLVSLRPSLLGLGTITLVAVSVVLWVAKSRRTPLGATLVDSLLLRLPVVGEWVLRSELHRFAFAMMTLTAGGAEVEEALVECASALSNAALRAQVLQAAALARAGFRLSDAFVRQPAFAGRMARWVAVGERTGSVEGTFAQLVGYLDGEIERDSERLIALMEPAAIIVVGILIIYLLFTFVLPILSLLGSVL